MSKLNAEQKGDTLSDPYLVERNLLVIRKIESKRFLKQMGEPDATYRSGKTDFGLWKQEDGGMMLAAKREYGYDTAAIIHLEAALLVKLNEMFVSSKAQTGRSSTDKGSKST